VFIETAFGAVPTRPSTYVLTAFTLGYLSSEAASVATAIDLLAAPAIFSLVLSS
jgi:hypothetical protein